MVTVGQIIQKSRAFRHVFESLEFQSSAGRRFTLELPFLTDREALGNTVKDLEQASRFHKQCAQTGQLTDIRLKLHQLRDIEGTLKNLKAGNTPDDIELFELKRFCLLQDDIRHLLGTTGFDLFAPADLRAPLQLLDPEDTRVPQFYIYPAYHPQLGQRAAELKKMPPESREYGELRAKYQELEDEVRQELAEKLHPFTAELSLAFDQLCLLDSLLARTACFPVSCIPAPTVDKTTYRGLVNPFVQSKLNETSRDFQPVDIDIADEPALITGSNMAGKSVLLKTVALAQYLFQCGFPVPAQSAQIVPVEKVMLSIGDDQDEARGLSSFAAEMLQIHSIVQDVKAGTNVLALVDEPAGTTNPAEGRIIVNALLRFLQKHSVRSLITTHYSGLEQTIRRLKVRGLQLPDGTPIHAKNIQDLMDYSLEPDAGTEAPHEAIRVAELLGVDSDLIKLMKEQ